MDNWPVLHCWPPPPSTSGGHLIGEPRSDPQDRAGWSRAASVWLKRHPISARRLGDAAMAGLLDSRLRIPQCRGTIRSSASIRARIFESKWTVVTGLSVAKGRLMSHFRASRIAGRSRLARSHPPGLTFFRMTLVSNRQRKNMFGRRTRRIKGIKGGSAICAKRNATFESSSAFSTGSKDMLADLGIS